MKKYNVFYLWVVEKRGYKFICKKIINNEYKEILTGEKILLEENDQVESLTKYYSILAIATYKNGQILNPLMLSKKDILLKYIKINEKDINKPYDPVDFIEKQKQMLEELKVLEKECPELAKKEAVESLQRAGILDEEGNLKEPYAESVREDIIPAKELNKQKTLDKK
ncbi:MAG: hypothetical protein E7174_00185 [Firmicutes bacterium]|nr:hypothetical protein [Bacillota bacterium]